MDTRARKLHEQYIKYKELESCKDYTIQSVIRKFHSIPLEPEDLECVAWEAFIETEEKHNVNVHKKTFKNFYRDCLYWKAKDYCVKYTGNKHMACNLADYYDWEIMNKDCYDEPIENGLISQLTVDSYVETNYDNDKGLLLKLMMLGFPMKDVCIRAAISKSKLYRVIDAIRLDLEIIRSERV